MTTELMKHKSGQIASFKADPAAEGVGEMIVNVFNALDSYNERSRPGCFVKAIARKFPKGVWAHDWTRPIAKTLAIEELAPGDARLPDKIKSEGGLWVKAAFNLDVQDGRDAFSHLKFGSVDEFSIGYYEVLTARAKDGSTDLLELDLVEWSPVLLGACPDTAPLEMKNKRAELVASSAPNTKSQYLGHYAEGSAAMAAVYSLVDSLFWNALYDALYDDPDEGESIDEVLTEVEGAFDEFKSLSVAIIRSIMSGANNAESAQKAAAYIRMTTPDPSLKDALLPVSKAFETQISTALAAVEGCTHRAEAISAMRAKDGRSLSETRRNQLASLATALSELTVKTAPEAPADTNEIRLRQLQRNADLRVLLAPA